MEIRLIVAGVLFEVLLAAGAGIRSLWPSSRPRAWWEFWVLANVGLVWVCWRAGWGLVLRYGYRRAEAAAARSEQPVPPR